MVRWVIMFTDRTPHYITLLDQNDLKDGVEFFHDPITIDICWLHSFDYIGME